MGQAGQFNQQPSGFRSSGGGQNRNQGHKKLVPSLKVVQVLPSHDTLQGGFNSTMLT
jgi:hypothetical protein